MKCTLFLIFGLALGCRGLPPDVARVQRLFESGAYEDAVSAADESLPRHPRHAVLWRVKVQSAFGLGNPDRAVADYQAWYSIRGKHDRTLIERIALTTFWQGLRVPSAQVQVRTIQAVERLEIEKLAKDVQALMVVDSDPVAAAAAVALLRSRPGAPRIASQLLSSDDPEARAIAVAGIARKVGRRARKDLAASLRDPDARVRSAGIRGFAAMRDAKDTAELVQLATRDADPTVRVAALGGLAIGKRPEANDAANEATKDPDPVVRQAAVQLLAANRDHRSLERIARSVDPVLALSAWAELRTGGNAKRAIPLDRAQALVASALDHDSWAVRAHAAAVMAKALPRAQAVQALRRLVGDSEPRVRVASATGLYELGERDAADLLSAQCRSESIEAREAAVRAHDRHDLVTVGLVSLLADESALVRVQAAEALLRAVR